MSMILSLLMVFLIAVAAMSHNPLLVLAALAALLIFFVGVTT